MPLAREAEADRPKIKPADQVTSDREEAVATAAEFGKRESILLEESIYFYWSNEVLKSAF